MKRIFFVFFIVAALAALVFSPQPARAGTSPLPSGFTRHDLGAGLSEPTAMDFDGSTIYVTEKGGSVRIIHSNGTLDPTPFKTLSVNTDSERGLLGIALRHNFSTSHAMFVYYTTGPGAKDYSGSPQNRVSLLKKQSNGTVTERIILDHIPATNGNHNGGDIHIGFDGKLWISVGDSGCGCNDAQLLTTVAGKILRINLNGTIPSDNPYFNRSNPNVRKEIWARGFRNPWRFTMRPSNQSYVVADVGQNTWEEIDSLERKQNYGWPIYEGPCPSDNLACDPNTADLGNTIKPIHWYNHSGGGETGNVIAGGVFTENPNNYPAPYNGAYFYGDEGAGWVHYLTMDSSNVVTAQGNFDLVGGAVAFGDGPDGNLYVVDYGAGLIRQYTYSGSK